MPRLAFSLWPAFALILSLPAAAGSVVDLFSARIEVDSQSTRAQNRAVRQAMRQVLVKVSGSDTILKDSVIQQQIRTASNYLRGYQFEVEQGKTRYVAAFSKDAILNLVRSNGYPVWDSRRPDTLMWLAFEQPGTVVRDWLREASDDPIKSRIAEQARARGIPVDFPLLDLEDLQNIGVFDVWGGFTHTIREASMRYGADQVVAARLYRRAPEQAQPVTEDPDGVSTSPEAAEQNVEDEDADGYVRVDFAQQARELERNKVDVLTEPTWYLDWQLLKAEQPVRGQFSNASQSALLTQFVEHIADLLAEEYAVVGQIGEQPLEIIINNVGSLDDYVNVNAFLSSLSSVANVVLVSQQSAKATFALQLLGSREDLLNTLRLDNKMTPRLDEFGREVDALEFEWQN